MLDEMQSSAALAWQIGLLTQPAIPFQLIMRRACNGGCEAQSSIVVATGFACTQRNAAFIQCHEQRHD